MKILKIILEILAGGIFLYIIFRLQMKAWLHELDYFLGEKLVNYINNKKEKKDGQNNK